VSFAESFGNLLRVRFGTSGRQIGVEEGEEDEFVRGCLREAAVAEGSCGTVDEGYAWVGEVGLGKRSGLGQVEDAADGAVAAVWWLVEVWSIESVGE
jgi:hypothetical protein